jgi:hypothetical protein
MENKIRKIISEAIIKILEEGRFDNFVGKIVGLVMSAINESKKEKRKKISYIKDFYNPIKISLILKIQRHNSNELKFEIDGSQIKNTKKIEIIIDIYSSPNQNESVLYNTINSKLNDVIRHEIEHVVQSKTNYIKGRETPSKMKLRNQVMDDYRYFLLPDEIQAMVAGMYRQAKFEKKYLDVVFSNYLDYFLEAEKYNSNEKFMTSFEKDKIMKTWIDYAKTNYPNAKFSK